MENKVLNSYIGFDNETIEIVKSVLNNEGKPAYYLKDIDTKLKYDDKYSLVYKPNVHIEMRRLFITELDFLNTYVKFANNTSKKNYVIYAGGSPGYHLYELSRYYPNITFIIFDTNPFCVYNSEYYNESYPEYIRTKLCKSSTMRIKYVDNLESFNKLLESKIRIFVIKKKCDRDLLLNIKFMLNPKSNIYFWSNENNYIDSKNELTDQDIITNYLITYDIIKNIQPEASMINFETPSYNIDTRTVSKYLDTLITEDNYLELEPLNNYIKRKILFPKGKLQLQPWSDKDYPTSRLLIKKKNIYNLVEYDVGDYDALFNYYNCLERPIRKHDNDKEYYKYGYCECNDCSIELKVLQAYITANYFTLAQTFNLTGVNIPNILGSLSKRLNCLFGTDLEIPDVHGINRII